MVFLIRSLENVPGRSLIAKQPDVTEIVDDRTGIRDLNVRETTYRKSFQNVDRFGVVERQFRNYFDNGDFPLPLSGESQDLGFDGLATKLRLREGKTSPPAETSGKKGDADSSWDSGTDCERNQRSDRNRGRLSKAQ